MSVNAKMARQAAAQPLRLEQSGLEKVSIPIHSPFLNCVVQQTEDVAQWRAGLKDLRAATAIRRRLERAAAGNLGDVNAVGEGVSEMRIGLGAGYRLYYTVRERVVVFLLVGGVKSTQTADIRRAIDMAKEI